MYYYYHNCIHRVNTIFVPLYQFTACIINSLLDAAIFSVLFEVVVITIDFSRFSYRLY